MNAFRFSVWPDDEAGERYPMRQTLPVCCAAAATDRIAAALVRSMMNLRRSISPPERPCYPGNYSRRILPPANLGADQLRSPLRVIRVGLTLCRSLPVYL